MGSSWPITAVTSEDKFSSLWDRCPNCHAWQNYLTRSSLRASLCVPFEGVRVITMRKAWQQAGKAWGGRGRLPVHIASSAQNPRAKWARLFKRKAHPYRSTLRKGARAACASCEFPATFSHSATSWGPSVQTREHMGEGSHLCHDDCPLSIPPFQLLVVTIWPAWKRHAVLWPG